ncbi:MAG: SPL family radical SAM protein [Promethearchaeia archaeon]
MDPINDKKIIKKKVGSILNQYEVLKDPVPHILVKSNKEIHGWWNSAENNGRRACVSERLLINPYNGCSWNCFFCYAHALWGYFELYLKKKIITVFNDFDKIVNKQLSNLLCASCGYISPTTDPFQPINAKYSLTEKIMEVFLNYGLPVEVITKGVISKKALKIMSEHPYNHSFGQVSILTLNDDLRKKLVKGGGANTNQLLKNIENLANHNIHCVCRIDPIIPYINDDLKDIKDIINAAVDAGANHIGTSIMDIPIFIKDIIMDNLIKIKGKEIVGKYKSLYTEKITSDLHANIVYRKKILKEIKKYCQEIGITMSTCMEFEIITKNNKIYYKSLNDDHQFMTSNNCEGIDIPIYKRKNINEKFKPVKCKGDCLYCKLQPVICKIPQLQQARSWKLKDYRKWSKSIEKENYHDLIKFVNN